MQMMKMMIDGGDGKLIDNDGDGDDNDDNTNWGNEWINFAYVNNQATSKLI